MNPGPFGGSIRAGVAARVPAQRFLSASTSGTEAGTKSHLCHFWFSVFTVRFVSGLGRSWEVLGTSHVHLGLKAVTLTKVASIVQCIQLVSVQREQCMQVVRAALSIDLFACSNDPCTSGCQSAVCWLHLDFVLGDQSPEISAPS